MATQHAPQARDFSAPVRRALLKKGIVILGTKNLPGDGPMPYANGQRGYELANQGQYQIRLYAEVVALGAR
jgi:hypothetical protein